jgi:hypothetical protein
MTSRKRNKGASSYIDFREGYDLTNPDTWIIDRSFISGMTILLVCGAILYHCEATELYCINALVKLLKNHQRLFEHERRPKGSDDI